MLMYVLKFKFIELVKLEPVRNSLNQIHGSNQEKTSGGKRLRRVEMKN